MNWSKEEQVVEGASAARAKARVARVKKTNPASTGTHRMKWLWLQDNQNHLKGIIHGSHVANIVFVARYLAMNSLQQC